MRKKLNLHRETLRRLDPHHLRSAVGGLRSIVNPPIPTVGGDLTCDICNTLTCLTKCDVCEPVLG